MRSIFPVRRAYWIEKLYKAWEAVPVIWLTGVRRVGKTTLAQEIPDALFLNCDLPSTSRQVEDPERFYAQVEARYIVFDEIHQLPDPSRLLKIGADEFGDRRKILATGSSTLAATQKFRDSLTGRKRTVHLLPVLHRELADFGILSLEHRLLHGGLPESLLADEKNPEFFVEWLDSYYARDVQELFRVGKRQEFLRLIELLLRQSGGLLEISALAKHCALSRPTVANYLEVLQVTHLAFLVRPYHAGGRGEILQQPKVYGFDTGFVSFCKGWRELREGDRGKLWEHLVFEALVAGFGERNVCYWRDKQKREVDFVLPGPEGRCDAVECKWNARDFSVRNLAAFRALHPEGANFVISPQTDPPYHREIAGISIVFCNLQQWDAGEAERLVRSRAHRSTEG
jgi:predicted AAA+ superfamily ATPase